MLCIKHGHIAKRYTGPLQPLYLRHHICLFLQYIIIHLHYRQYYVPAIFKTIGSGNDIFIQPQVVQLVNEALLIIKYRRHRLIYNRLRRPVVVRQYYYPYVLFKPFVEIYNVPDTCPLELIDALVIIAYHKYVRVFPVR